MTEWKVPVQSLIDHIKTAVDVDPWAKQMAEELLKEQEAVVRCKDCKNAEIMPLFDNAIICKKHCYNGARPEKFYCADGERRDETT